MSDTKSKVTFDHMAFIYEAAVNRLNSDLFGNESQYGWTLEEFDAAWKNKIIEEMQNAAQGNERILH